MTRPLIFLVLNRITRAVNEFLSLGQHAYRAGRSTTEVVWTAQWLLATAEKYSERIHITSLDLSKAFDNLDRGHLLNILEEHNLAGEDELRIISFPIGDDSKGQGGSEHRRSIQDVDWDTAGRRIIAYTVSNLP